MGVGASGTWLLPPHPQRLTSPWPDFLFLASPPSLPPDVSFSSSVAPSLCLVSLLPASDFFHLRFPFLICDSSPSPMFSPRFCVISPLLLIVIVTHSALSDTSSALSGFLLFSPVCLCVSPPLRPARVLRVWFPWLLAPALSSGQVTCVCRFLPFSPQLTSHSLLHLYPRACLMAFPSSLTTSSPTGFCRPRLHPLCLFQGMEFGGGVLGGRREGADSAGGHLG